MKKKINLKVILVGDQAYDELKMGRVGKTSLLRRFVQNKFVPGYKATIGADFMTKEIILNDQVVTLQCWDTAGQEQYHALSAAFYKGSNCCVLVYDITDQQSFNHLGSWRDKFLANVAPKSAEGAAFVVLGNKSDDEKKRKVHPQTMSTGLEGEGNQMVPGA